MTDTATQERPIIFSGEMVRAILDGRKTQTRRLIRKRKKNAGVWFWSEPTSFATPEMIEAEWPCLYGQVGDRLWVRESIRICGCHEDGAPAREPPVWYMADGECPDKESWPHVRPSIHMSRWACRIMLEITKVWIHPLQNISEYDARSEGMKARRIYDPANPDTVAFSFRPPFADLWDSLNAKRGYPWASNHWVRAMTFKKVEADG